MNRDRRFNLESIQADIQYILGELDELKDKLESIKEEEQEACDNLYDRFPSRAEEMEYGLDYLDQAIDNLENSISYLEDCDGDIEEAKG